MFKKRLASYINVRYIMIIALCAVYVKPLKGGNDLDLKSYSIKEGKEYLIEEWDREKNSPATPETVNHSSSMRVWWKCEKGHVWQTQLRSRSASLTRCPKCNEERRRHT